MSWFGVKRSPRFAYEDALWAAAIRRRDNFKCRLCGRSDRQLNASHYFGRAKKSVRWDVSNGFLLCSAPCHRQFDQGKNRDRTGPSDLWVKEQLGQREYDRLLIRASLTIHPNREAIREALRNA
jgi:hypothetical protein